MMDKERIAQLRSRGIMIQRDGRNFSVRIGAVAGQFSAQALREIAELSEKFAACEVHLTTRQAIEIHHVPSDKIDEFIAAYSATLLKPARSGSKVRTVVSCPGNRVCKFAGIDSRLIAEEIERRFGETPNLPSKIKFAVAGCTNSCTRARYNDIGVLGAGKGRYELYVGGKGGRSPQMGQVRGVYNSQEELLNAIGALVHEYASNAQPKHRIGQWLNEEENLTR